MHDDLDLIPQEKPRAGGVGIAVGVSIVLHTLVVVWLIQNYRPAVAVAPASPIVRYVELLRQNPDFVEAPGPGVDSAPLNAPYSDANRRASTPEPIGETPTTRPGSGATYIPPAGGIGAARGEAPAREGTAAATAGEGAGASQRAEAAPSFAYREQSVDWRSAIRQAGKVASLGGGEGLDLGNSGGEKGFAESGPLSFETQWYDWGEYAAGMVSRIRINWHNIMPQLIQTGLKGVVTIRFTIQRDGRITDVTILQSSGAPPYDFAAKRAIELSSPLNPLPKDFPNSSERVTAMFYYNTPVPQR